MFKEKTVKVEHNPKYFCFLRLRCLVVAKKYLSMLSHSRACQPRAQWDDTRGVISILLCLIYWTVQVSLRQHELKYFYRSNNFIAPRLAIIIILQCVCLGTSDILIWRSMFTIFQILVDEHNVCDVYYDKRIRW